MLTYPELLSLSHALRDARVLSVFVDGAAESPSARRAWRIELDRSLKELRRGLAGASHDERAQFDRCVEMLEHQLAQFTGAVGAPGWFAYISGDDVAVSDWAPVRLRTLAMWRTGMCVAPYVRALKQTRRVVAVVADARMAELYTYATGALVPIDAMRAREVDEAPLHMGDAPRLGFHAGVRGDTGHDATQRAQLASTERLMGQVSRRASQLAGADGWIVVGGTPQVASHLSQMLWRLAPGRVLHLEGLDVHATAAEIVVATRKGASTLRDRWDTARISEIIATAEENGTSTLGLAATRAALEMDRVRELYLTPQYVDDHVAEAEDAVRAAFAQGALVEELSRDVASRLDAFGGMAARLRYAMPEVNVESAAEADATPAIAAG